MGVPAVACRFAVVITIPIRFVGLNEVTRLYHFSSYEYEWIILHDPLLVLNKESISK